MRELDARDGEMDPVDAGKGQAHGVTVTPATWSTKRCTPIATRTRCVTSCNRLGGFLTLSEVMRSMPVLAVTLACIVYTKGVRL